MSRWLQDALCDHFIADPELRDLWTRLNAVRANGFASILDNVEWAQASMQPDFSNWLPEVASASGLDGRSTMEQHFNAVLASVNLAAARQAQGFAVVKLSSLCDPQLLQQLSDMVSHLHSVFELYDTDGDGMITHEEFDECFELLTRSLGDASADEEEEEESMCQVDFEAEGEADCSVDYVSWVQRLDMRRLVRLASGLVRQQQEEEEMQALDSMVEQVDSGSGGSPTFTALLDAVQEQQLEELLRRVDQLVDRAVDKGVRLLIDSEPGGSRSPAVHQLAHHLMRLHNDVESGQAATVYVTYPAFVPEVRDRLTADLARALRQGYRLGANLVGSMFLQHQQQHEQHCFDGSLASEARELLRSQPIPVSVSQEVFDSCVSLMLAGVKAGVAEVVVSSAHVPSVEMAVELMESLELDPAAEPVHFCQPLASADSLTFALGSQGYKVFKYLPYGDGSKVAPYLIRCIEDAQGAASDAEAALEQSGLWGRLVHDPAVGAAARVTQLMAAGESALQAAESVAV